MELHVSVFSTYAMLPDWLEGYLVLAAVGNGKSYPLTTVLHWPGKMS